jgi:hypothetical protein
MRQCLFSFVVCVALTGNPLVATGQSLPRYPAPVPDFAQWERFPAECASYRRSAVTAYAPALADYSVAYDRYDATLQNAVTLFFYPRMKDPAAQLRAEEAEVTNAHRDGHVVGRRSLVLERDGTSYEATLVTFEYGGLFAGKQQSLNSQLWVVFLRSGTFKVRSTAPIDQAVLSEASVQQLLQCVAWPG